jgi:amino acid adenylation domain-containing protein
MTELSNRIAELSPEKLRLLAQKLGKKPDPAPTLGIEARPAERHEPFALTEVQQAYWLGRGDLFSMGNVSAHGYSEIEVHQLDLERFNRALVRVIDRHDMLRMVVDPDGRQRVLADVPAYRIAQEDVSRLSTEEAEERLLAVRLRMSHQVLPSDRWPLFEIAATRLAGERTRLHVSFDILIADLWSYQILMRDLAILYDRPEAELVPLGITFRDYVVALEAQKQNEAYRRSERYWAGRLESLPPAPQLPLAIAPETLVKPRFVRRSTKVEPEAWSRLKGSAAAEGLSPSALLVTAYGEVLAAWSKSPRFTLNLTLFSRLPVHPQINEVVGDFTTLTLLEVDGSAQGSFLSRVRGCQKQLWQDLEHSQVGAVTILRELSKLRGRQPMPIVFTSSLTHDSPQPGTSGGSGFLGEMVYSISQTPQVWLDHQVSERDGTLYVVWDAVEELFPAGVLDAMFSAYGELLERLASGEGWDSSVRSLLPAVQRERWAAYNATEQALPPGTLHDLFLEQAAARPSAPAVLTARRSLAYGELELRSRSLAHRLLALGVAAGELVAVVMEKGWEQVVAVLGIVRAGAAYLPIEASVPADRRASLLAQGGVRVVVTQGAWSSSLAASPVEVLVIEEAMPASAPPLVNAVEPSALAYVIFTSGSTGRPKGVAIDHRGAVNTILDLNGRWGVGPSDRVLGLSSLSFDLSVWDVFGLLAAGGAVVLPEPEAARDPGRWRELMVQHGVTVWNTVPALLEMLVEHVGSSAAGGSAASEAWPGASPRLAMLSGDWIALSLPERVSRLWPGARLMSLGGATEASIWSIYFPVERVEPTWKSVPYGHPLANQTMWVLDEGLEPRPEWVAGELYIGGAGVALGYFGDEERTSAQFLVHPRTGERLYRTGDWARLRPEGWLEFLGREDAQVKVQGHRIELGEIESWLERHPQVRAGVVLAVGEARGNRRLVGYFVPKEGADSAPASAALQAELAKLEHKLGEPGRRRFGSDAVRHALAGSPETELEAVFAARRSVRRFAAEPIEASRLGSWLEALRRLEAPGSALGRHRYPSAGTLYPVQAYVYVAPNRVTGVAGGTYYYDPKGHELVELGPGTVIPASVQGGVNRRAFEESAWTVFLVADRAAIEPVYGELWRDFSLLEAGYASQLLMEVAPGLELGVCPIGTLETAQLGSWFELGESHAFLHSLVVGPLPSAEQEAAEREGSARQLAAGTSLVEPVRTWLRQHLPDYMVPPVLVELPELPLTANGKVDRNALASLALDTAASAGSFVVPSTPRERLLAQIWTELLGVPRVGVDDNFFALGGDSVQAVQFLVRARQQGLELATRDFFAHQTIRELAVVAQEVVEAAPEPAPKAYKEELAQDDLEDLLEQFGGVDEDDKG